jgi:hypothetical protein
MRREVRVSVHVNDDCLRKVSRRPPAGRPVVINDSEVLEEIVTKACLRRDSQRSTSGINDLDVATICSQHRKGVFETLVDHCRRVG